VGALHRRPGDHPRRQPLARQKAGGITTILEKSLGSVAKGGRSPLAEIVDYAAVPTAKGFVFMDTPGYDPVSATGLVAGGANVIAFTTGRGSVFGSRPVPTEEIVPWQIGAVL
jgi:altronate hydrolase